MITSPKPTPCHKPLACSDAWRLRRALNQRIRSDRRLAWKLFPLLLTIFIGSLAVGIIQKSQLGEDGASTSHQGQQLSFEGVKIPLAQAAPAQESPISPSVEAPPPESLVELERPAVDIEVEQIPNWESVELDIPSDAIAMVKMADIAFPEAIEKPKPQAKATPSKAVASSAASSSQASKSSLGASSSKAAGRISVSYKYAPQPPYPTRLRASKTAGTVVVRIQVDAHGKPQSVSIKKSSGHSEFDDIARSWILSKWSFNPAKEGGHSVASVVTTSIHFIYS